MRSKRKEIAFMAVPCAKKVPWEAASSIQVTGPEVSRKNTMLSEVARVVMDNCRRADGLSTGKFGRQPRCGLPAPGRYGPPRSAADRVSRMHTDRLRVR